MSATIATPLAEPCLMPLGELIETHRNYERRIAAILLHDADDLTPDEKAHALEVERVYGEFKDALRFTITRREARA